ncbi:hypothetical protein VB691_24645 [Crocosphaera sp. XPORK-15E]|nr:hypothetical protein [Crocosphaera sp. XPORK-15E]
MNPLEDDCTSPKPSLLLKEGALNLVLQATVFSVPCCLFPVPSEATALVTIIRGKLS